MKVGINLINWGPSAAPEALHGWVRTAEALGYHSLLMSDHIAVTADVEERYPDPFYEPLTTLGWLAGVSRTLLIGTTVAIVPYRHPLEMARAVANLDQMSGGRIVLGVGVGWARQEFEALGIPFARRGAMTDEYLAAMKACWRDEVASFEGEFVRFREVRTRPPPRQSPHPPIWVGGGSDAALRRAAEHGDAWHPIRIRFPRLEADIARLEAAAAAAGRPRPAVCPRIWLRLTERPLPEDERCAGEGSIEQVHGDLARLEALGCPHVLLDSYCDDVEGTRRPERAWRMLAALAEQVLDLANETVA